MPRYQFSQFFSLDSPKAIKARTFGYMNAINYLAPAETAGVGDMCPWSSVACRALCSSARAQRPSRHARQRRRQRVPSITQSQDGYVHESARAKFMREVRSWHRPRGPQSPTRSGLKLCVSPPQRRNLDINLGRATIKQYPEIQFVDYTKSEARALAHAQGKLPANYHVTFSFAGDNHAACERVLAAGGNVAVCFKGAFPTTWFGHAVVDGDLSDLRHLDPRNVVIALSPKGAKAKREGVKLGFVIDTRS